MVNNELHMLLDIQDQALTDQEYLEIHKQYEPVQERFLELWLSLPKEQQDIIGDYLYFSAQLFHRLMIMACKYTDKKGTD